MNFILALLIPAISSVLVNGIVLDTRAQADDVLPRICDRTCGPGPGCVFTPPCSCSC
ncbi:hypothetical protein B0H19DRAFT_1257893 [Mycena capillaripes]|nr:hypothetical protein B0H19DRAFT_1257893 [Mycena capillaripes]